MHVATSICGNKPFCCLVHAGPAKHHDGNIVSEACLLAHGDAPWVLLSAVLMLPVIR